MSTSSCRHFLRSGLSAHEFKDPLMALVAAILRRAILDLQQRSRSGRSSYPTLYAEAFQWVFQESTQDLGSFAWCCAILDQDVKDMRRWIKAICQD